jgi:putative endonuclease
MGRHYFVYIMASRYRGTMYVGVTGDLQRRAREHREGLIEGFTKTNDVKLLVYYEIYEDPTSAIQREKLLKRWRRAWKFKLIEEHNPDWKDRSENLINELPLA